MCVPCTVRLMYPVFFFIFNRKRATKEKHKIQISRTQSGCARELGMMTTEGAARVASCGVSGRLSRPNQNMALGLH